MGQLRKSSYIISTRLHDGKTMWIHGYTGAIDILSARLADYLDAHDAFAPEGFPLGEEVFARLAKRGYLTANTKEEEQAHVAHVAGLLHEAHKRMYKNFGFVVTYNCNFRCPYCFENGISSNGQAWSGQVFTRELVDRAYATITEQGGLEALITKYFDSEDAVWEAYFGVADDRKAIEEGKPDNIVGLVGVAEYYDIDIDGWQGEDLQAALSGTLGEKQNELKWIYFIAAIVCVAVGTPLFFVPIPSRIPPLSSTTSSCCSRTSPSCS